MLFPGQLQVTQAESYDCMSGAGWEALPEGGGGAGAGEEGLSLGWFCTDKSLHFSRLEKAVWAVHICRESRSLLRFLALQLSSCHSVKPSVYFFHEES